VSIEEAFIQRIIEARSRSHFCRGNAVRITYSECVSVALVVQLAKRMRRVLLWCMSSLAVSYFSTLSPRRHDFRGGITELKMRILVFSTTFFLKHFSF
jgi:hypothetical protein